MPLAYKDLSSAEKEYLDLCARSAMQAMIAASYEAIAQHVATAATAHIAQWRAMEPEKVAKTAYAYALGMLAEKNKMMDGK